jgi:hypothetical protein
MLLTRKGLTCGAFRSAEGELVEVNYQEALAHLPHKRSTIWLTFPYAFSGISGITSKVNISSAGAHPASAAEITPWQPSP